MINLKTVKFFIGPMTQNVIDSVIEFANEEKINLGFCVSRRQIDYDYGYVEDNYHKYDTPRFVEYVKSKTSRVIIERDHAGLAQGKKTGPSLYDMHSLLYDAAYVDIIHIDPWKKFTNNSELAVRETINNIVLTYHKNPNILFEVGTEEAIYCYQTEFLLNFLGNLKYELGDIFTNNVKYCVVQAGTKLEGTRNVGKFDLARFLNMQALVKSHFGLMSKEHNGDYLTNEEIKLRFDNGLDAINIAPEFGVIETKVLLDHIKLDTDFKKIYDICLKGEKWKRWVPESYTLPFKNKRELVEICGHYHNKEIKKIVNVDDEIIKKELKNKLKELNETNEKNNIS